MGIQTQDDIDKLKKEKLESFYNKIKAYQNSKKERFLKRNDFTYSTNEKEFAKGINKFLDFGSKYPLKDENNRKYRLKKKVFDFSDEEFMELMSDSYDPEKELEKIKQISHAAIALVIGSLITLSIIYYGSLNKWEALLIIAVMILCINLSLKKI